MSSQLFIVGFSLLALAQIRERTAFATTPATSILAFEDFDQFPYSSGTGHTDYNNDQQ
jgi:hypothetical protein